MKPLKSARTFSLLVLSLTVFATATGHAQQSTHKPQAKRRTSFHLAPLIGKPHQEFEKFFGKPVRVKDKAYTYHFANFEDIRIYEGDVPGSVAALAFTFKKEPDNWESALKTAGLDPTGSQAQDTKIGRSNYWIKRIRGLPNDWKVLCALGSHSHIYLDSPEGTEGTSFLEGVRAARSLSIPQPK